MDDQYSQRMSAPYTSHTALDKLTFITATQREEDPRRLGQQNTGFLDEDVSDILCVLYPHSASARQEVYNLARANSPFVIGRSEADNLEIDHTLEDDASHFESMDNLQGNYALMLRLSSRIKNPAAGFSFGRNSSRCDVVFSNDPMHRISNVHFRIYVNEHGTVMLQDQSTNGTCVDDTLLAAKGRPTVEQRRVLISGTRIRLCLHEEMYDITFRVRIPHREGNYEAAYLAKVMNYFARHNVPRNDGVVVEDPRNIFAGARPPRPLPPQFPAPPNAGPARREQQLQPQQPRPHVAAVSREWTGSDKYNKTRTIGKGAFAVVYKVTSKYDGNPYAAKELEKRRFIKNGVLDLKIENEMKIMQRINHPNIVRYIENFDWEDRLLIIIMEYVQYGDLGKFITENGPLAEDVSKSLSVQLLSALGYLHTNSITHRDIKPDNILISNVNPLEVKLTDFGLSKMVETEQTFLTTFCGTLLYCAPEVYTEFVQYDENGYRTRNRPTRRAPGQRYSHAVDVWSLGGVLFYCMTGAPPYPVKNSISPSDLLHRVMTTPLNIIPLEQRQTSARGVDFICRMLQRRPEYRATVLSLQEHTWLKELEEAVQQSQSYDQLTDDESYPNAKLQDDEFGDHVSESLDGMSDVDDGNGTMTRAAPEPRLFGEVGVSAIGSSGVIPESQLNLPADHSLGETDILDPMEDEAYNSSDSAPNRRPVRHFLNQQEPSMYQRQSMDQLQSLVEDVASQSLGNGNGNGNANGNVDAEEEIPPTAHVSSIFSFDPNTSKRKPTSHEASEEWDENTPPGNPMIKRLKSETNIETTVSDETIEEYKLIASVPEVRRLESGRQMDNPVDKTTFWSQDQASEHLLYPEFTQLQHSVFKEAAKARGEQFEGPRSALWKLAMKYFPPTNLSHKKEVAAKKGAKDGYPSSGETHVPTDRRIVPVQAPGPEKQVIGVIESHLDSSVKGISIPIADAVLSFGRGPENTCVYEHKLEARVPKYAFKLMLWKDGFDPSRNYEKRSPPWKTEGPSDAEDYYFWISTKATKGIIVNGHTLQSYNPSSPASSSRWWTKVYNNDVIYIFGNDRNPDQTRLVFKCFWGGSSRSRSETPGCDPLQLELASTAEAEALDTVCPAASQRVRETSMHRRRIQEAETDLLLRNSTVWRERLRSEAFQKKRLEAIRFLAERQPLATRKSSTGSGRTVASEPATMHYQ